MAQPRITSSTPSLAAGYLSSSARITNAPRSSGRVLRNVPRGALPTGVRKQSTIRASGILVPQWLPVLQHVLHALLRLYCPAQAQECFALQIQQILLAHLLGAAQAPAAQH